MQVHKQHFDFIKVFQSVGFVTVSLLICPPRSSLVSVPSLDSIIKAVAQECYSSSSRSGDQNRPSSSSYSGARVISSPNIPRAFARSAPAHTVPSGSDYELPLVPAAALETLPLPYNSIFIQPLFGNTLHSFLSATFSQLTELQPWLHPMVLMHQNNWPLILCEDTTNLLANITLNAGYKSQMSSCISQDFPEKETKERG